MKLHIESFDINGNISYQLVNEDDLIIGVYTGLSSEANKRNALIGAAAPDLLKAAEAVLPILDSSHHHSIDWARGSLRNAINKAKGEEICGKENL